MKKYEYNWDFSKMHPDRSADGKAKNPNVYLDSIVEADYERWLLENNIEKVPINSTLIKRRVLPIPEVDNSSNKPIGLGLIEQ